MAPFQSPGCTIGTLGLHGDSLLNVALPSIDVFGHSKPGIVTGSDIVSPPQDGW